MSPMMSKITECDVKECHYNKDMKCNALAINVGGSGAVCHAFVKEVAKCDPGDVSGGVGACKQKDCRFNDCLMCTADGINVRWHSNQALCHTYTHR